MQSGSIERLITMTVDGADLSPSTLEAGYAGENNSTALKFIIPNDWPGDARYSVILYPQLSYPYVAVPDDNMTVLLPVKVMLPGILKVSLRAEWGENHSRTTRTATAHLNISDTVGMERQTIEDSSKVLSKLLDSLTEIASNPGLLKGEKGDRGNDGASGPQGVPGSPGATGTPGTSIVFTQLTSKAAYTALPVKDPSVLYYWTV